MTRRTSPCLAIKILIWDDAKRVKRPTMKDNLSQKIKRTVTEPIELSEKLHLNRALVFDRSGNLIVVVCQRLIIHTTTKFWPSCDKALFAPWLSFNHLVLTPASSCRSSLVAYPISPNRSPIVQTKSHHFVLKSITPYRWGNNKNTSNFAYFVTMTFNFQIRELYSNVCQDLYNPFPVPPLPRK